MRNTSSIWFVTSWYSNTGVFGKTSFTLRRKAMTEKEISHYNALKSEIALSQTSSRLFHSFQFIKCRGISMKLNSYGPYSSLMFSFSFSLSFFFLFFCLQIMTIHSLLSVWKVGVSEWARKNSESREKTGERVISTSIKATLVSDSSSYDHLFKTPFELRLKHCYEKPSQSDRDHLESPK